MTNAARYHLLKKEILSKYFNKKFILSQVVALAEWSWHFQATLTLSSLNNKYSHPQHTLKDLKKYCPNGRFNLPHSIGKFYNIHIFEDFPKNEPHIAFFK